MPSHGLIRRYADIFEFEREWRWNGAHYQRTALDWLTNFDRHRGEIEILLRSVYGDDTQLGMRRWRWFFEARQRSYQPSGIKIFTSSRWIVSLPHTTLPVASAVSPPSMPLTMPPASRTMINPAAISHGCRLRSQ